MEDYEFPIPTSHIRVELLSQIGKTDLKITSGKLLISVDIPLLDRKALQLYKIYPFPVFQGISGNYTRAVYILPRKQYIALTIDERKFFLADKEYYDTCRKTIYHTICKNTQPIHETFFWETKKDEKLKNLHMEESLSTIEEQLLNMENNHYKHKLNRKYWLGGSSILTLSIITTALYLTRGIIRKNSKICNNKNLNIKEKQEKVELQPLSVDNQTNTEEIHPIPRVLTIPTTNVRIA